ncbi:pentapeptide repeat-containing protein, partial [Planctomycetota bacterium]
FSGSVWFMKNHLPAMSAVRTDYSDAILGRDTVVAVGFELAIFDRAILNDVPMALSRNETTYRNARITNSTVLETRRLRGAVDFSGATLSNVTFGKLDSIQALKFDDVAMNGVTFDQSVITKEHIYSTANYKNGSLAGTAFRQVDLGSWDLSTLDLVGSSFADSDLSSVNFRNSNLDGVDFEGATLFGTAFRDSIITNANLAHATDHGFTLQDLYSTGSYQQKNMSGVRLTSFDLSNANLSQSNLSRANIEGANLVNTSMTLTQLYSTKSYADRRLNGITLRGSDLSNADFSNADLSGADFSLSNLNAVDFSHSNLTGTNLGHGLAAADFEGATIDGAILGTGFSFGQFRTTANYRNRRLVDAGLIVTSLDGWDLSGFYLDGVSLSDIELGDMILTDAVITNVSFGSTLDAREKVYSTKSYKDRDLRGIGLQRADLSGWDLRGQNLSDASLQLTAGYRDGDLTDAIVRGADFWKSEFNNESLYSTHSYKEKSLQTIRLTDTHLFGTDLSEQDLRFSEIDINSANLNDADLAGAHVVVDEHSTVLRANLRNSYVHVGGSTNRFNGSVYNQWTHFINPQLVQWERLVYEESPTGDVSGDGLISVEDIDFTVQFLNGLITVDAKIEPMFDFNGDSTIDEEDHRHLVSSVINIWFGDANLDGEFNSTDLVTVFAAGQYQDSIVRNSNWATGDWNGDQEFDSSDFIIAFQDGGYERGRRQFNAVPEGQHGLMAVAIAFIVGCSIRVQGLRRNESSTCKF